MSFSALLEAENTTSEVLFYLAQHVSDVKTRVHVDKID
jgi:hypothetical protein